MVLLQQRLSVIAYHKQLLPNLHPFAQHLRAFGNDWILLAQVLQVNKRFGKDAHWAWLPRAASTPPRTTFLEDFNEIAHVKCKAVIHVSMPVVDRWEYTKNKKKNDL